VRSFSLLIAAFLLGAALVGIARADDPDALRSQAEQIERENEALSEAERQALLELYALETSLRHSERRLDRLRRRLAEVAEERRAARRHLEAARAAERIAQQRLERRVVALYVEGEADPLEIILGASSLDDAISAIDGLRRLAEEDGRIAEGARTAGESLRSALRTLTSREAELADAASDAEQARSSLVSARDEKAAYLASLQQLRELNDGEIRELSARASEAERLSSEIEAASSTPASTSSRGGSSAPASAPLDGSIGGGRQLTVDAVAYSLPGYTASGLPVGRGVVAVDPAVIPLGTRLYVPGYGPAIAADVGSAIKGLIIDLWFPTYEQAAAWGRQTVTITIHG
jgi:3D (Asp-Asp-Asp) domain-containing protein